MCFNNSRGKSLVNHLVTRLFFFKSLATQGLQIAILLNINITNTYTLYIAVQYREISQTQGDENIESITIINVTSYVC